MSETANGRVPLSAPESEDYESAEHTSVSPDSTKKSKKKLLIIVAAALMLLAGGGFVAWKKSSLFQTTVKSHLDTKGKFSALNTPILLGIPTIISNLDSGDGHPVYVKLTAKVEVLGASNEASLQDKVPEIQDMFQTYLHETRAQDIRGNGIYRLREAMLRRLRANMAPLQVTNLYLVEFLVQ